MDNSILQETIERVGGILGPELDRITVERAVVGVFFTGVKLSNGIAGACATPIETVRETFCCASAVAGGRSPGNLSGCPAFALAGEALRELVLFRSGAWYVGAYEASTSDKVAVGVVLLVPSPEAEDLTRGWATHERRS